MDNYSLKPLRENPELYEKSALWFSQKWRIPLEAYRESIGECIKNKCGVPQWYVVLDNYGNIAAGAGVIENDFHDRPDLTPNLCALYVEPEHRMKGLARRLLDFARNDMYKMGFDTLYLVTDHEDFYEKCGWEFFTTVNDVETGPEKMYRAKTK